MQLLAAVSGAGHQTISVPPQADPVFARVPFLVDDKPACIARATEARVELADFYATPVHPLTGAALREVKYEPGSCPNAEWMSQRVVSLPINHHMKGATLERTTAFLQTLN